MTLDELTHMIERFSAQAAYDEAMAKTLFASAFAKREMVDTIIQLKQEMEKLREQEKVLKVEIGTLNGNYFENIQNANLCQPSSTHSTETTSNTSTPSTNPTIRPLKPKT